MTPEERQLLSGPEGEGTSLLPRPPAWAVPLPTSTRNLCIPSGERKPVKLSPGKGVSQHSIWAPVPALLWSWHGNRAGLFCLLPGLLSLGPLLANPEKKSSSSEGWSRGDLKGQRPLLYTAYTSHSKAGRKTQGAVSGQ